MSAILVTGGAGFIGSHLCEALLQAGHTVINVDSLNDFYDPEIKKGNISEIFNTIKRKGIAQERFELVEGDIRDYFLLESIFLNRKIELIVHLAAYAGVRPSIDNPLLYADVNVNGTLNLLEMCRKYSVSKFIFASSSSVYGNNKKVPFSEDDNVDFPISPYAATKKAGELLCHAYHALYGIDVACLRFFTVYGPRQRPDLAIHKFAALMAAGKPVPFYGDGTTERDYTYIGDIIDGVVKSIDWVMENKGLYEIFNLGESRTVSLNEMLSKLEAALGMKADLQRLPLQPGDVRRTFADISKAKMLLGYNPSTAFEEGIDCFIQWFKSTIGGYNGS